MMKESKWCHSDDLKHSTTEICEQSGIDNLAFTTENDRNHNYQKNNNCKKLQEVIIEIQRDKRQNKYAEARKILYPYRKCRRDAKIYPITSVGLFSFLYSSWLSSFMWKAVTKGIQSDDMWIAGKDNSAGTNSERLERMWLEELKHKGIQDASFVKVCFRFVRTRVIITCVLVVLYVGLGFFNPAYFVRRILTHVEKKDEPLWVGLLVVFSLTVSEFLKSTCFVGIWIMGIVTGVRLRGAALGLIYKKLLRLRSVGSNSVGEIVNACNSDGDMLFEAAYVGSYIIVPPLIVILMIIYTTLLLGPWALLGCILFLLFYPFQALIAKYNVYFRKKGMLYTDKRIRLLNGLLTNIKLIKMYAWENSFIHIISALRKNEIKSLENSNHIQSLNTTIYGLLPTFVTCITLIAHVMTGNFVTSSNALTVAAIFMSTAFSISVLPLAVKGLSEGHVSANRIKAVLLKEEIEEYIPKYNSQYDIVFTSATLAWESASSQNKSKLNKKAKHHSKENICESEKAYEVDGEIRNHQNDCENTLVALFDINLKIKKGSLIGICGSVGSGKSSFMSAILGEMIPIKGTVNVYGSVALVPQQAWIFNATLQENILFGLPLEKHRYENTIYATGLIPDFQKFPQGDAEEVGERGNNLSGGQRQRISLARAVYSNSDIYLLDDPLSALDNHVGNYIFNNCIKKMLKGKTVILASHQLQFIKECDTIYFIKDGIIFEQGTHSQLMGLQGEYFVLFNHHMGQDKDDKNKVTDEKNVQDQFKEKSDRGYKDEDIPPVGLMIAEEKASGNIKWSTYIDYTRAAGGICFYLFILFVFVLFACSNAFSNWWLSYWIQEIPTLINKTEDKSTFPNDAWSRNKSDHNFEDDFALLKNNFVFQKYMFIHAASIIAMFVFGPLKGYLFMKAASFASKNLHDKMIRNILQSPLSFFDQTPTGRILNRFSKDLEEVDNRLPFLADNCFQGLLSCLYLIIMISFLTPWFLVVLVPLLIVFLLIDKMLYSMIRDIKRLDNISRSPLVTHINTTIEGISCLRSFHKELSFIQRFEQLIDHNNIPFSLIHFAIRWVCFRVDLITIVVITTCGLLIVLTKGQMSTAFAGLALSCALRLSSQLQYILRLKSETQARYTCVERISHYLKNLETEVAIVNPEHRPSEHWPTFGQIKFSDVDMRYREDLPLVLQGISFELNGGEKLGIVGRTGSGKSTLGMILFRLFEPCRGTITIDGYNISQMSLHDLRSKLSVIPQEPVLFEGTIRYNLDPFDEYSDENIWVALDTVNLKDKFLAEPLKLNSVVGGSGGNFSVGQRQLLCLARALLKRSKVLLMDEATANVDTETDSLIQKTIRQSFSDCTVMTIAHRLNTILYGDKVMVMNNGKIAEFDTPFNLIQNPNSIFHNMLSPSMVTQFQKMYMINNTSSDSGSQPTNTSYNDPSKELSNKLSQDINLRKGYSTKL